MSFQAPYSITDMRRLQMAEAQNEQAMQQQNQQMIMNGLMQLGGAFMEHENMKSSVKSGEKLLDVMGPSFGMTSEKLKQFDYGKMGLRDKFMFHQGWLGNVGTLSQAHNFGIGNQTRRDQQALTARGQNITVNMPAARAQTAAQAAVAGGQGTINRSSIGYNPAALRRSGP
jgi:hypothetical protein